MTKRSNRIWVRTQSYKKHTWIVLPAITPSPLFVHLQNPSKPSFLFFSPLSLSFFSFGLWWSFLLKVIMPLSLILSYRPQKNSHYQSCLPSTAARPFDPWRKLSLSNPWITLFIWMKRILSFFSCCRPSLLKKEHLPACYSSFNGASIPYDMFVVSSKSLFFLCFSCLPFLERIIHMAATNLKNSTFLFKHFFF